MAIDLKRMVASYRPGISLFRAQPRRVATFAKKKQEKLDHIWALMEPKKEYTLSQLIVLTDFSVDPIRDLINALVAQKKVAVAISTANKPRRYCKIV